MLFGVINIIRSGKHSHTYILEPTYLKSCYISHCLSCSMQGIMLRAEVTLTLVSASDITHTDRWLNVWCIRHTKVETLQELRSRPVICWIIQDFRETCVSRSSTGNKDAVTPNPPHERRKLARLQLWWQDQINAGFSKVCEIFIVHGIESLKHVREFHTPVYYCGGISTPWNAEQNKLWLVVGHVAQTASCAGLGQ